MPEYTSCEWIEHGIVFDCSNIIGSCSHVNPSGGGRPIIKKEYRGEILKWEELFEIKNAHRQIFKEGKVLDECENCLFLTKKNWDEENYIDKILLTPWYDCNSKCCYCYTTKDPHLVEKTQKYNLVPVIEDMIQRNILKKDAVVDFAGGEPTIFPDFEELLRLFVENDFKRIDIHTNAIKYSKAIEKGITENKVNILVSIDAGSKEIHEKVKNVKSYDIVWENLSKYAIANPDITKLVRTKYIVVPEVNDSMEEITLWLKKSKDIGIKCVVLNFDSFWLNENKDNIPQKMYNIIEETLKKVKDFDMHCDLYAEAREIYERNK